MSESARPTPWDVVFATDGFDLDAFAAIEREAKARDADAETPDQFLLLSTVGDLLHRLAPDSDRPADLPPPDAVRLFGPLVFQAFHFQRHGKQVISLDETTTRAILDASQPIGEWVLEPPARAGYLQLPKHLLWARASEDTPPEPADGLFWTQVGAPVHGGPALALLFVLGLRDDRPGFTVVDAMASAPSSPGHWADTVARPDGKDFANILPGGELSDLHGLVNIAELFKLVSRAFHHLSLERAQP